MTIATTGNAIDFGDLINSTTCFCGSPTSPTRAVFAGGYSPNAVNIIEFVEIATTGNGQNFGDLTNECAFGSAGSCSNGHGGL